MNKLVGYFGTDGKVEFTHDVLLEEVNKAQIAEGPVLMWKKLN